MSTFDARVLIDRLPPFSQALEKSADFDAFLSYYGIDLRDQPCRQRLGFIVAAGYQIAVHQFTPPQPQGTAVLVHGYHDHHALYGGLIRYLVGRGLKLICFDLPGHGLSSGTRGSIGDFNHYQQVLKQVLQSQVGGGDGPLHLVGQSTGAAIINHYLLLNQPVLEGQVIQLAPLVRPAQWLWIRAAHWLLSPFVRAVPRKFTANSHDQRFLDFLKHRDPLQCLTTEIEWVSAFTQWLEFFMTLPSTEAYAPLIIQGGEDGTVDWTFNLKVLEQKFPRARVLVVPEGRHHLANESESIRNYYLHWLDQHWPRSAA